MTTTNLGLSTLKSSGQSNAHIVVNTNVLRLDATVQLAVIDKDLAAPPGSPAEGAKYIVAGSPTGAWSGKATYIATYTDSAWIFHLPKEGWSAYVSDEDYEYRFSGSAWLIDRQCAAQADTTAADLAALKVDFNAFLAKMRTAKLLAT